MTHLETEAGPMYRGRYQQGDFVPLGAACTNAAGAPVAPDAAATVNVYGPTGVKLLAAKRLPPEDRYGTVGLVAWGLFLDATFTPGHYTAVYQWTAGAFHGGEMDSFEVLPGGDPKGAVISMYWFERPQASYVVQQLDSGRLIFNRNPYL